MEPINPSVPENQPSIEPSKPTAPFESSDKSTQDTTEPKLAASSFGTRTITPLESNAPQLDSSHLEVPFEPSPIAHPVQSTPQPVASAPIPPLNTQITQDTNPYPPIPPTSTPVTPVQSQVPTPATPQPEMLIPAAFVSQEVPESQLPPPAKKKSIFSKPVIAGIAAFIFIAGGLGFYFGYYNNPSVIYSQSMKNTSKGYEKLVEYVDKEAAKTYKGSEGSGSLSIKAAGFSTDGNLDFKADKDASQFTFDLGLGVTRLTSDARLFYVGENSADIYLKAGGIKGLGTLAGYPELDAQLAKLDDTWVVIDHTLLDSLSQAGGSDSSSTNNMNLPTQEQLLDEAQAFGEVNKEYLFTGDKEKSVMTVTKNYGFETIQGRKTYHYQATLNKQNAKKYIDAQAKALKASKLQKWIKSTDSEALADEFFTSLKESADTIKSTDTVDVWVDASQRIIYKVRFADKKKPLDNYLDVGLNYKGGDKYPFFLSGFSKTGDYESKFTLVMTLDTSNSNIDMKLDVQSGTGDEATTLGAKFAIKPSNSDYKIEKPANAKQLAQVLSELGYGDILTQIQSMSATSDDTVPGGIQSRAADSKRQVDIKSIQVNIEAFYAQNGYYPSLAEINSTSWRKANMKGFDSNAMQDPDGSTQKLAISPAPKVYSYKVTTASGGSCEADSQKCAAFTLTATLSDGSKYTKVNLN